MARKRRLRSIPGTSSSEPARNGRKPKLHGAARAAWASSLGALICLASCNSDFSTAPRPRAESSLGDDLYSALCDRLGASVLTEDLEGASYHKICHIDNQGEYASAVDVSKLPVAQGQAAIIRGLAVGKLEALARRRPQLIAAFNATFSNEEIQDPWSQELLSGHSALSEFMRGIAPLYEEPITSLPDAEAALPSVTRATGRLFAALGGPGEHGRFIGSPEAFTATASGAQHALASISGRRGYRPLRVSLGALRPALAYPELRPLAQTLTPHLIEPGPIQQAFQDLLGMLSFELASSEPEPLPSPLSIELITQQPSRPRTKLEVLKAALLSQHPSFGNPNAEPRYLAARDHRGVVLPTLEVFQEFLTDKNSDGFADIDSAGRFLGNPERAPLAPPFVVPTFPSTHAVDSFGRALAPSGDPAYQYLNTSQSLTAALIRDLEPMLDPDPSAPRGGSLLDLLSGSFLLYGKQEVTNAAWAEGGEYLAFNTQSSPLLDLIHAAGQLFAHPSSDSWLELFSRLIKDHEQSVARVLGAALETRAIANQHPEISLKPESTFWDDLVGVIVQVLRDEGLLRRVLKALEHPNTQNQLLPALSRFMTYADRTTYDSNALNSPQLWNISTNNNADPIQVPVNRNQPDTVGNQSQWYQALQIIHDMNGVNACNRPGAKVRVKLFGVNVSWPLIGSYDECELLRIRDIGLLYLDALIDHYGEPRPPEGRMEIEDGLLNGIMNLSSSIVSIDQVFEESSHIDGMSLFPSPAAFNRLVFFGTTSSKFDGAFGGALPDRDPLIGVQSGATDTNEFITGLIEPLSTSVCPTRHNSEHNIHLADCALSSPSDLLRLRGRGAIFTWEKHDFYSGIAPLVQAFDDPDENGPLFLELIEVLYRHWPTEQHGPECNKTGSFQRGAADFNPKYCAESGLSRYEPILSKIFSTDLIPAVAQLTRELESLSVEDPRNGRQVDGISLLRELGLAFFDSEFADQIQMRDRAGHRTTSWSDGSNPQTPITPFELFAKAMRNFDLSMENSSRRAGWRRARSNFVDTFLSIEGEGGSARFANRSTRGALPILIEVLRQQINANCPNREQTTTPCAWATREMTLAAGEVFSGPSFSTVMQLVDQLNQTPETREELAKFLSYLLKQSSGHDALHSTLTSITDLMQLLGDQSTMPPIYNAISFAAAPGSHSVAGEAQPGAADRVVRLIHALTQEGQAGDAPTPNPYDKYRMLDRVLARLVTPIDPTNPSSETPLEIYLDTLAEVNRLDARSAQDEPMSAEDFAALFGTLRDFMLSETRGMEQFYQIIRDRQVH